MDGEKVKEEGFSLSTAKVTNVKLYSQFINRGSVCTGSDVTKIT